jgi:hypothetical protein
MSDAIVAAIEDHRRADRVVRARRLWKRRLAQALWAIDDDIDAITEGPEEWEAACADLEAAEQARERALLRLTNIRPSDLDRAATWIAYLTSAWAMRGQALRRWRLSAGSRPNRSCGHK